MRYFYFVSYMVKGGTIAHAEVETTKLLTELGAINDIAVHLSGKHKGRTAVVINFILLRTENGEKV